MTIFINGRFLSQETSGVQRFAFQIINSLDRRLLNGNLGIDDEWVLLAPWDAKNTLNLERIEYRTVGTRTGHAWEQLDLFQMSRRGYLVNLCNAGPVFHKHSLTIIHDAMVYRTPANFSWKYRCLHKTLDRFLAKRSHIGTVSEFSRRELSDVLGLEDAFVVPNSCEHMLDICPDPDILRRLGISERGYFLFVGSPTPNKNLATAIAAVKLLDPPAPKLVVVGAAEAGIFGSGAAIEDDRIIHAGRLLDSEIAALYRNAVAFVFPSLYEGFGVPPLEAMLQGCPVVVSDIPVIREVCGNAALYVDPKSPAELAAGLGRIMKDAPLRENLVELGKEHSAHFTWDRSVSALLNVIAHDLERRNVSVKLLPKCGAKP